MPNLKNVSIVETLKEKIKKAKSIIVTSYSGLKSEDMNSLRAKMRDKNAEVAVAKNTLIKLALKENDLLSKDLEKDLKGNTAVILGYEDALSPIKVLFDFVKNIELPNIISGVVDGSYNSLEKLETLSKLPSKEELIAKVVGGFKSPINGIVNVLGGSKRKIVIVLAEIAKTKSA